MPTSSDIWGQIQDNQAILDDYLGEAGTAPGVFREGINKAVQGNIGAIKNAAGLESEAYALPGDLMNRYDEEFGGQAGIGAMSRMGSILKNIGQQFGLSNAAWGVVDNAKLRQEELLSQMNQRFTGEMNARQQKHNNLLPLWQQLFAAEEARKNRYSGGGGSNYTGGNPLLGVQDPAYVAKREQDQRNWNAGADAAWDRQRTSSSTNSSTSHTLPTGGVKGPTGIGSSGGLTSSSDPLFRKLMGY